MQTILDKKTGDTIGFPDEMAEDQIFSVLNPTDQLRPQPKPASWYDQKIAPLFQKADIDVSAPSFVHVDAQKMKDDIARFGAIRRTPGFFENIYLNFQSGVNQTKIGKLGNAQMWRSEESEDFQQQLVNTEAEAPENAYRPKFDLFKEPVKAVEDILAGSAQIAPFMAEAGLQSLALGALGALGGPVGSKVGQTVGVVAKSVEVEGGGIYVDLRKQGVSHNNARAVSIPFGLAIGMVEALQFETITRSFSGAKNGTKKAIINTVSNDPELMGRLMAVAGKFFGESSEQIAQEDVQEMFTIGAEIIGKMSEQKSSGKEMKFATLEELAERIKQTTIESAKVMPLLQLPGAIKNAHSEIALAQKIQAEKIGFTPEYEGELHEALIEEQSNQINDALKRKDDLLAKEVITVDEKYELDSIVREFGYIDPQNTRMIKDQAEMRAEEFMSEHRAIAEAKKSLVQHLIGKNPNIDMSVAIQTVEEYVAEKSAEALSERKVDAEDPTNLDRLKNEIKDELQNTDTDQQVAEDFSNFWVKMAVAASRTQGITPAEWYMKNKLRIQRADGVVGADVLFQGRELEADPLTAEAKKYKTAEEFIGSKKPVYHGTNQEFEIPSIRYAGRTDEGFMGAGIYASGTKGGAKQYGKNVKEFYFDLKNPLVIEDAYAFGGVNPDKIRDILGIPKTAKPSAVRDALIEQGYDGVIVNEITDNGIKKNVEVVALGNKQIKTKAQLTEIWNKAQDKNKDGGQILFQDGPSAFIDTTEEMTEEHIAQYEVNKEEGINDVAQWIGWEPERTKGNVLKGAPEGVTSRNLHVTRALVRKFTREGKGARFWYRDTARTVLKLVQGNVVDADKFIQLLAIYSPNTALGPNTMAAVKVWNQYKNGAKSEEIHAATEDRDNKARAVLFESGKWDGRKTNSFYLNIMHEIVATATAGEIAQLNIDKSLLDAISKPVTVDVWMLRAFGYDNHSATDDLGTGKYSFVDNEIRRVTAELNQKLDDDQKWLPHEVQAAMWVSIKGRYEIPSVKKMTNEQSIKKKYTVMEKDPKTGKKVPIRSKDPELARKHLNLWRNNALNASSEDLYKQLEDSKVSFADVLNKMTFRITAEAIPSKIFTPELVDAEQEIKSDFTERALAIVTEKDGTDSIAKAVGANMTSLEPGNGGYDGQIAENVIVGITPTKKAGPDYDHTVPKLYQKVWQYLFKQDAVPYFRAEPKADFSQDFIVRKKDTGKTYRRFSTQVEAQKTLDEKGDDYEMVGSKYAKSIIVELQKPLNEEQRIEFLKDLDGALGNGGGHTVLHDGSIVITNFRDDDTNLPFMDDVIFEEKLEEFLNGIQEKYNITGANKFGSEGNYGFHDWKSDPEGKALEDYISNEGSSNLLSRVRDWKLQIEQLTEEYKGKALEQRRSEFEQAKQIDQARSASQFSPENLFQGESSRPRGWVQLSKDPKIAHQIFLTDQANESTLFHEASHIWLMDFQRFIQEGNPTKQARKDWKILKNWLNIKKDQTTLTDKQQEKFARGFETYLREGRAPSAGLRRMFKRFKKWLTKIYKDVKNELGVKIDDAVRGVFDRMLEQEENPIYRAGENVEVATKVIDKLVDDIVSVAPKEEPKKALKSNPQPVDNSVDDGEEVQVTEDTEAPKVQVAEDAEKPVLGPQREGIAQKPVLKTGGVKKASKAFERIKARYQDFAEENSLSYDAVTLAEDTARAMEFVEQFPAIARRVAFGIDAPPSGVTETAISIAYSEAQYSKGNLKEFASAEKARSLRQTRRGQEIAAERGRADDNSPSYFIEALLSAKLELAGRKIFVEKSAVVDKKRNEGKNKITKILENESVKIKQKLAERKFNAQDAQNVIEGMIC
jgi:hypothetical protein